MDAPCAVFLLQSGATRILLAVNCRFAKGMTLRMMLLGGNGAILVGAYELVKRLSRKTEPTPGFS